MVIAYMGRSANYPFFVLDEMLTMISPVKPHNTGLLFLLMTILGVTSITLLPIALELSADLTKNADGSSAILWFM